MNVNDESCKLRIAATGGGVIAVYFANIYTYVFHVGNI